MSLHTRLEMMVQLGTVLRQWALDSGLTAVPRVLQPNEAPLYQDNGATRRITKDRKEVLISYSHKDKPWLDLLHTHLKPYVRNQTITIWDDTKIKPGKQWFREIEAGLTRAKVAVLLVSPNFLASDFIAEHELPPLLTAEQEKGLTILWIPISCSSYEETEIAKYQSVFDPSRPLDALSLSEQNSVLVQVCKYIKEASA